MRTRASLNFRSGGSIERAVWVARRTSLQVPVRRTPPIFLPFSVPSCPEKEQSQAQHCLSYTLKYGRTVTLSTLFLVSSNVA